MEQVQGGMEAGGGQPLFEAVAIALSIVLL
jgi:hypothetical protein